MVENPVGTSPGILLRDPVLLIALPGVPPEFQAMLAKGLEQLALGEETIYTHVLEFDKPEVMLQQAVIETLERFPQVKIGSYPQWQREHRATELRFRSKDLKQLQQAVSFLREHCR